jgi:hypothetical protein
MHGPLNVKNGISESKDWNLLLIADVFYLFYCEHNWYSIVSVGMVSIDEIRHCRHICGTF